jgi:Ca2+-binding EF-hand superfamily protein
MGQVESSDVSHAFAEATSLLSALELAEIGTQFNQIYARGGNRGGHLLNREEFSRYFQLPVVLGDRLFAAFDLDKDGMVNFEEFVCGLAICLRGTIINKAALLFKAFNLSEDEGVSRQELATMLNSSFRSAKAIVSCTNENQSAVLVGRNEAEIVEKVVDDAFENCDITKTGKLLPIEFEYWLKRNPQLMEGIFDAICPQMRVPVRQSFLIVPDAGDSANQSFNDQIEVASTGDLRSEPSLEDIIDGSDYQDAITEDNGILSERKTSIENESDISANDDKPVESQLQVVEDYYTALPSSEHVQGKTVSSTSEWTDQTEKAEKTELDIDEEGKTSIMEEILTEDDVDSSLPPLAENAPAVASSHTTNYSGIKLRPLSATSLPSPTISLTSLPPTPDLEPERTHIAWLPSEQTRQLLNARQSGVVLEQQFLSSPGLQIEGPFVSCVAS